MAPPRGASGVAVPTDAEIRVLASSGQYGTLAAAYRARMGAVTILSADELRFTADAALRMSDFQTASHALKRIGYDHSTSPHAPDALLQGGILIGRELRRPADGQKLLRHLIQSYPQSPAAEQARRLLGVTQ